MSSNSEPYLQAAERLHQYIVDHLWNGYAIIGADPIGKINWRITRFVRNYTGWLPWRDRLIYLQGLSYWIFANLALAKCKNDDKYFEFVEKSADFIASRQLDSGAWEHPPIEFRVGFTSAVESVWASLGLVAAYKQLKKQSYLDAVLKGHRGIIEVIGTRQMGNCLAVNYYSHSRDYVPNVTTMYLWLAAEVFHLTGDTRYLEQTPQMINFIARSQMDNGELQYIYNRRPHFQCFQYNAFQFIDLANYYQLANDSRTLSILKRLAEFLSRGLTANGSSRYDCFNETPEINYWTGALAAALRFAHDLGLGDYLGPSEKAYRFLVKKQRVDGSYGYSKYNYRILKDNTPYPRYLGMILHQLLYRVQVDDNTDKQPPAGQNLTDDQRVSHLPSNELK